MAKSNLRSFRYSDEVAGILEKFKGQSLNEKFENLVLHCFWERPKIEKELKALRGRYAELDKLYREKQRMLCDLNGLLGEKQRLIAALGLLEKEASEFSRRMSEHVTQSETAAPVELERECVTASKKSKDVFDASVVSALMGTDFITTSA